MGCAGSKRRRCSYCDAPYSPSPRGVPILVAHPSQQRGESNHFVSLTSTTLGSLSMRSSYRIESAFREDSEEDLKLGLIEEKTWSDMIETKKKPPMTPCMTPPGDPEIIDAWEIMNGLEGCSPLNISLARKSLSFADPPSQRSESIPKKHEKVVFYFTSLRGVRRTFEDCCNARGILRGYRVKIDERDVSMHSGFKEELRELLGDTYLRRRGLPRVFIGAVHVGGADDIKRLHEEGQLEKLLRQCEKVEDYGKAKIYNVCCSACGDVRFVPCETCSGSCKVFYEEDESVSDYEDTGEIGFRRCPDCNENGLIRCRFCCD